MINILQKKIVKLIFMILMLKKVIFLEFIKDKLIKKIPKSFYDCIIVAVKHD